MNGRKASGLRPGNATNRIDQRRGDQPRRAGRARRQRAVPLGQRTVDLGKLASDLGQTSYQWAVKQQRRLLSTRRGRIIAAVVAASLLLGTLGTVGLAYAQYSHVKSQATIAVADLKSAETNLKTLETNPFDTTAIAQAHDELGQANAAFIQMNNTIQSIPGILSLTPIVGSKLDAAFKIGPIAVEATEAGMLGCDILSVLASKLKSPLSTNIPGMTNADISTIDAKFNTLYSLASTMLGQIQELPSSAASLDPHLGTLLATVGNHLPEFTQGLQDAKNVVALLPQLLGVGKPANYLLEVMDSTELRPGGGFIGNFGDITLSGGRMQGKPVIKDVDLLDQHYKGIPVPSQYSWFTAGSGILGFQDSNVDADFPTNAQRAIQLYDYSHGSAVLSNNQGPITSFQGVIGITPWLIEGMLQITGGVTVTDAFGNTISINSTNLIQEIHYHQLAFGQGGPDTVVDPNPICHGTSYRKCFTTRIFSALMSKLGTVSTTSFGALGKLLISSIHTKDIQIYFTAPGAEAMLLHHNLASALTAPQSGDSLMVVDANEGGVKSNNYMDYAWKDQVSLDSSGTATHKLLLTFNWPYTTGADGSYANAYPADGKTYVYQDYIRIYVPSHSHITAAPNNLALLGGAPDITSGFGLKVVEGLIFEPIGTYFYISMSWTVPHAAVQTANGWLYQYAVEKQAGINTRRLEVALTLPSCAQVFGTLQGFTTTGAHTAVYNQAALLSDVTVSLQYTC